MSEPFRGFQISLGSNPKTIWDVCRIQRCDEEQHSLTHWINQESFQFGWDGFLWYREHAALFIFCRWKLLSDAVDCGTGRLVAMAMLTTLYVVRTIWFKLCSILVTASISTWTIMNTSKSNIKRMTCDKRYGSPDGYGGGFGRWACNSFNLVCNLTFSVVKSFFHVYNYDRQGPGNKSSSRQN